MNSSRHFSNGFLALEIIYLTYITIRKRVFWCSERCDLLPSQTVTNSSIHLRSLSFITHFLKFFFYFFPMSLHPWLSFLLLDFNLSNPSHHSLRNGLLTEVFPYQYRCCDLRANIANCISNALILSDNGGFLRLEFTIFSTVPRSRSLHANGGLWTPWRLRTTKP